MSLAPEEKHSDGNVKIRSLARSVVVGPRHRPLIIERPELQSPVQRWSSRGVTILFWGMWVYFFMPLVSVLAWAAGFKLVYEVMVQNLELSEFWLLLKVYGTGIGILLTVYLGYATAGYFRYRNVERRKHVQRVTADELVRSHHLDEVELRILQKRRSQVVSPEQLERMFPGSEVQHYENVR